MWKWNFGESDGENRKQDTSFPAHPMHSSRLTTRPPRPGRRSQLLIALLLMLAGLSLIPTAGQSSPAADPRNPFPTHIPAPDGTIGPTHLRRQQQDSLVGQLYDRWKADYLVKVEQEGNVGPVYRITAGRKKQATTFSEGQGYGMVLVAYMAGYDPDAQQIFDGLHHFARRNPSRIDPRLMAYAVPVARSKRDSAFDGDCDMAFALLLADAQWGSSGQTNYLAEARTLISALEESVIGAQSRLPLLGDWVKSGDRRYNQYTIRSSDIMPGHFHAFYVATGHSLWLEVLRNCQATIDHLQQLYSPKTGLLPDFLVRDSPSVQTLKPAGARFLESAYDGQYYYNAARVPWRLGTDALLTGNPRSMAQVRRIASWVVTACRGNPSRIPPGYRLTGERLNRENYISKAFVGPFGVAAMTLADQESFVNAAFDLLVSTPQDYYEDSIGLFCLLLMTGNTWLPF